MVDPLYNMSYHVDSDVPFGKLHLQKKQLYTVKQHRLALSS